MLFSKLLQLSYQPCYEHCRLASHLKDPECCVSINLTGMQASTQKLTAATKKTLVKKAAPRAKKATTATKKKTPTKEATKAPAKRAALKA